MLLGAISNHAEIPEEGRQLAAVMLRRLFSSEFDDFFGKVSVRIGPGAVEPAFRIGPVAVVTTLFLSAT